ncbi:MAG TPA: hypothetical protein ENJ07_02450 [Gammaproteobacteria bacterium]|nr:hypothetical protein [Gammaproteobacteria bacterium]
MNIDINFARLSLSWKLLVTGFVIILCSGYLAAVLNAALSVGMDPQAIADHYADKSVSSTEAAAIAEQGFVEEEFSFDDEEDSMADMSMGEMAGMDHSQMDMSGMDHGAGMSGDDTLPPQILAQVSHVHLLSFSLLLLAMGGLMCLTQMTESIKALVVSLLFLGLWGDIISLNLVRFVSGGFAYMTFVMGTIIGLCFAFISFRVLWELWLMKPEKNAL